jgi:hypothetical protein
MPATITTPSITTTPPDVPVPQIQIKQGWQDQWQYDPQLLFTSMSTASAAQDLSQLVFHRRYGTVKDTHETAYPAARVEVDLTDWWLRVRLPSADATEMETVWIGRVSGDDVSQHASSAVVSGVQNWVAHGPSQILRKRSIGRSFHLRDGEAQEIGWVPPLNDPTDSETGNRSDLKLDDIYLYGGTGLWTYRDYVEYLLKMFLDESATNGPEWTLAGLTDVLAELRGPIRWGTTQTANQMLRRLIPLDRGLDFTIRTIANRTPSQGPDWPEAGFEVFVFAVSPHAYTFAGVTMPPNQSRVTLDAGAANDLASPPVIVTSNERKYKRIRVLGKRIVVCCSLWGANAPNVALVPNGATGTPPFVPGNKTSFPTLVKKWSDDIETEYKTANGASGDEAADYDAFRRQDKYTDVYSSLGAPFDWDMNNGHALPWCDNEGALRVDDPDTPAEWEHEAPYQLTIRRTLPWLPLKEGEDWTDIKAAAVVIRQTPYDEQHPRGKVTDVDDHQADYLPPIAWLFDVGTFSYVDSTTLGIGCRPKRDDWGILLKCSPNHLMGFNHFGTEADTKTTKWPRYDWEAVAATIAFEADQRYTMEWADEDATDKDGVLEIEVNAEAHYLAPNTIVASPFPDSTPAVVLSGDKGRLIREDRELMGLTMAGAISRYSHGRKRASITVAGLSSWHDLVGQVLDTIDENGQSHDVNGVVCGVRWERPLSGSPKTIIKAGYAS